MIAELASRIGERSPSGPGHGRAGSNGARVHERDHPRHDDEGHGASEAERDVADELRAHEARRQPGQDDVQRAEADPDGFCGPGEPPPVAGEYNVHP
jgi:hypothetical protein